MADYVIKIELPSSSSSSSKTLATSDASGESQKSATTASTSKSEGVTAKDILQTSSKVIALTGIKRIAESYIQYDIGTISLRTGATEREQRTQVIYSEVSQGLSSIGAIAAGAAMGGWIGAGVAALGVGVSYLTKFIGWSQNADKLALEKKIEDVSIGMARTRAGVSNSRSARG